MTDKDLERRGNTVLAWIDDALDRMQRDEDDRGERETVTTAELLDAIWARLPVTARRTVSRAEFDSAARVRLVERGDDAVETAGWWREQANGGEG